MGGPIVRTGTTPEFWKNWDNVFGDGKAEASKPGKGKKTSKAKANKQKKSSKKK